jgi:hypothetical protein
MKITKGKLTRPQRVVIYGVESVGKTTFASQFPNPLYLDVEGGTAHLDVPRVEIATWPELLGAVKECASTDFETIVIDSIDWAEKLCTDALLTESKKTSVEDFGYGKGYVMLAERITRFLSALDGLIDAGKNVVLIGHSHVKRVEPPDLMTAYDRYELKLSRQVSPLVKEWADELWFFQFKTKVVEAENGKARAIGGKVRVLLTTHAAAYDAKTRSGLAEELPMEWASVAGLFQKRSDQPKPAPTKPLPASILEERIMEDEANVIAFLTARKAIKPGQTWRDAGADYLGRIETRMEEFMQTVSAWVRQNQKEAA